MAQRKKRRTVRKGKSTARRKTRKPPKSARLRPAKRRIARAAPRKRPVKAKLKPVAKKARKRVTAVKPPITPAVEPVTDIEATKVREADTGADEPEARVVRRRRNQKNRKRSGALRNEPMNRILNRQPRELLAGLVERA